MKWYTTLALTGILSAAALLGSSCLKDRHQASPVINVPLEEHLKAEGMTGKENYEKAELKWRKMNGFDHYDGTITTPGAIYDNDERLWMLTEYPDGTPTKFWFIDYNDNGKVDPDYYFTQD